MHSLLADRHAKRSPDKTKAGVPENWLKMLWIKRERRGTLAKVRRRLDEVEEAVLLGNLRGVTLGIERDPRALA
jgi:hypothetical protein